MLIRNEASVSPQPYSQLRKGLVKADSPPAQTASTSPAPVCTLSLRAYLNALLPSTPHLYTAQSARNMPEYKKMKAAELAELLTRRGLAPSGTYTPISFLFPVLLTITLPCSDLRILTSTPVPRHKNPDAVLPRHARRRGRCRGESERRCDSSCIYQHLCS
jgi:hypothetical protein